MGNIFKKIFSLTRDNESKPDFQTCCTPMEVFDEQKVKAIIKHWLLSIDEYETIPDDIVALNFNLWEAVEEDGVDLMGYTPWGCIATFECNPMGEYIERTGKSLERTEG